MRTCTQTYKEAYKGSLKHGTNIRESFGQTMYIFEIEKGGYEDETEQETRTTQVGEIKQVQSVLQCVAVCCSVLQRVAVCCSVLQCVTVRQVQKKTHTHDS